MVPERVTLTRSGIVIGCEVVSLIQPGVVIFENLMVFVPGVLKVCIGFLTVDITVVLETGSKKLHQNL